MPLDHGRQRTGARIKARADSGNYERVAAEAYFTIDAAMMVDVLLASVAVTGPVLEPAAGRGDLVSALRGRGYAVTASDLHVYSDPLVDDIAGGVDLFSYSSLAGFGSVVTNLPYGGEPGRKPTQDRMLEHLLPIAARDGCVVATIVEWQWACASGKARGRGDIVHRNPRFAGLIVPPRRLKWFGAGGGQSQHVWAVWTPAERDAGARPFVDFITRERVGTSESER